MTVGSDANPHKVPYEHKTRVPVAFEGVQVNFCKNPSCKNFGVPVNPYINRLRGAAKKAAAEADDYIISGYGKGYPSIKCQLCNEGNPVKSNIGIKEEFDRLSAYLKERPIGSCPNEECENHSADLRQHKDNYQSFGHTKSGSARYRCKLCRTTFSVGKPTRGQKKPSKTTEVYNLLVNKLVIRRACNVANISPSTLYGKLDYLYEQCLAFVGNRERRMMNGDFNIKPLFIGVDRQEYVLNWTKASNRKNIRLSAVGSADNRTGYVFGMDLNYDDNANVNTINGDAHQIQDIHRDAPFRRHARLWLLHDYYNAAARANVEPRNGLIWDHIKAEYEDEERRPDKEQSEYMTLDDKLPYYGMQVHYEYTLYGHFMLLQKLFQHVDNVTFYLDQDAGMRAACLASFHNEIMARKCDAFWVKITKEATITQKRCLIAEAQQELQRLRDKYSFPISDYDLRMELIKEEMRRLVTVGKWKDRWLRHPMPNNSEPEKSVCYLTDLGDYDINKLAYLYNYASLHSIDRFFMQVRRKINMLERPISSASSTGRKYYAYAAYNPQNVVKLLTIFRVYYNYIQTGDDKQTPAMRLGLAKGKVSFDDIIHYK